MSLLTNLVAYYKLDESSGNAADSSGAGLTLTNNNSVTYVAGKINNGASGGTANPSSNSSLNNGTDIVSASAFSISCWCKSNNSNTTDSGIIIYAFSGSSLLGYQLGFDRNLGNIQAHYFKPGVADNQINFAHQLNTSGFDHLVLTYDGTTLTLYLNGTSVASGAQSGSGNTNRGSGIGILGGTSTGGSPITFTPCSVTVDEVGFWQRALTSTEVTSLYNGGAGLAYPLTVGTLFTKNLTETPSFTDTLIKAATKVLTQAVTYTDTFSHVWTLGRTLTEAVTNTASLIKTAGKVLLETVSYLDTFVEGKVVTVGPNSPNTAATASLPGGQDWTNPNNIKVADGSMATITFGGGANSSYYLEASDFGFSIPSAATIIGILVEVNQQGDTTVGFHSAPQDYRARLIKGGVVGSTDRNIAGAWSTTLGYVSHGGPNDLWGDTWSPSEINASSFGFALAITQFLNSGTGGGVDHIRITVSYILTGNQWTQTLTDAVTAADTLIKTTTKLLSEAVAYANNVIRVSTRAIAETTTMLDTVLKGAGRTLADTFTSSDTFIGLRTKAATLTETISYVDTQTRAIVRAFVETVTNTATFTGFKATIGTFADSFASSDTLIKSPGKVLSEAVAYTASFIRSIGRLLTESATMTDAVTGLRARVLALTDTFTAADALIRAITRPLVETVTYTDVISSTKVFFRTLTESATLTASLVKSTLKNLIEAITSSDTFSRVLSASRVFTETVTYSAVFRLLKNGSATIWRNVQKNTASLTNAVKHVASLSTVAKHISTWRNKDKS